jgi:hypothetical protein
LYGVLTGLGSAVRSLFSGFLFFIVGDATPGSPHAHGYRIAPKRSSDGRPFTSAWPCFPNPGAGGNLDRK